MGYVGDTLTTSLSTCSQVYPLKLEGSAFAASFLASVKVHNKTHPLEAKHAASFKLIAPLNITGAQATRRYPSDPPNYCFNRAARPAHTRSEADEKTCDIRTDVSAWGHRVISASGNIILYKNM